MRKHIKAVRRLQQQYKTELRLLLAASLLLFFGVLFRPHPLGDPAADTTDDLHGFVAEDIRHSIADARKQIATFENSQAKAGVQAVPDAAVQQQLSLINVDLEVRNVTKGRQDLKHLEGQIPLWQKQVTAAIAQKQADVLAQQQAAAKRSASKPTLPPEPYWQVPILIYHHPPANFGAQLSALIAKGYHSIDFDQLYKAITVHAALPSKPVIITFDDGFADQLSAFNMLKADNLKATFFIIDGGAASNWCIGAGRRYNDPLQPASGCGDAYLSWDQVRILDASGLITIGSHTIDHSNLPSLSPDQQRFEIVQGKAELESELGHPVYHFAYPYGSYNATTVAIVRGAGFLTAVSTLPGIIQTRSSLYALHRVRDAYILP